MARQKTKKEIVWDIEREIAVLSESGTMKKMLTLTSWNYDGAKLDLRVWRDRGADGLQPCRGLTLEREEAEKLIDALTAYLAEIDAQPAFLHFGATGKEAQK